MVPAIGYEQATSVAKEALESGRGVYDIVLERGLLSRAALDKILNPESMTAPRRVSQVVNEPGRSAKGEGKRP